MLTNDERKALENVKSMLSEKYRLPDLTYLAPRHQEKRMILLIGFMGL